MATPEDNSNENNFGSSPKKKGKKKILALFFFLVILGGGVYYWQQDSEEQIESQPLIVSVEYGDIENTVAATGSLQPSETVEVGAQVSGLLEALHVEAGDYVEEGQLLAEIDARQQLSRVESSRANIAGLEAQIEARRSALLLAEANAQRQEMLRLADATSEQDYDTAMNTLMGARASLIQLERQIDQSAANLAIEETKLEFTQVVAPIAGTVVSISLNEGRTLNALQQAPTILTIADLSLMTVETEISEADVGNLQSGMEVYFTTLGGGSRRWSSSLRQILPQPTIENNVVLYTGLFDIDNEDGALLPAMTAQVYFVTSAARNVLTVPIGALTFLEGGPASAGGGFNAAMGNAPRPANAPPGFARPSNSGGVAPTMSGMQNTASPSAGPRRASVKVQQADGAVVEKEILVGVTSRVAAEVLSGLQNGDQVIAGVMQGGVQGVDREAMRNAIFGGRAPR